MRINKNTFQTFKISTTERKNHYPEKGLFEVIHNFCDFWESSMFSGFCGTKQRKSLHLCFQLGRWLWLKKLWVSIIAGCQWNGRGWWKRQPKGLPSRDCELQKSSQNHCKTIQANNTNCLHWREFEGQRDSVPVREKKKHFISLGMLSGTPLLPPLPL